MRSLVVLAFPLAALAFSACGARDELAPAPRAGADCPSRPECVTGTVCELDRASGCEACKCDDRVPPIKK